MPRPLRRLLWLPALAGPVALVAVIVQFNRFVAAAHWNSDAVATALVAEDLAHRVGGATVLGDVSSLSTLTAFVATEWVPGHRWLWGAMPYALTLLGIALLSLVSYWLAGRWAAATTAAIALAVSADVLFTEVAAAFRATTWFSVALLVAFVVVLARDRLSRRWLIASAGAIGAITGINVVSDPLLVLVGLVPVVVALMPIWVAPRPRRTLVAPLVAFASGLVIASAGGIALMHALDLTTHKGGTAYLARARGDLVARHIHQYWTDLLALAGTLDGPGAVRWWGIPAAIALIAGLIAIPVVAITSARRGSASAPMTAFLTFWSAAILLLTGGFVVSGTPNGLGGVATDRYLVPLVIAVAATLPVICATPGRARCLGALAATALVIPGLITIITADMAVRREAQPQARQASAIAAWLGRVGTTRGYADYFTALATTYNTQLVVRTLEACRPPSATVLCRGTINTRDAWYARDGRAGTFIMVNRGTGNGRGLSAALRRAHLPRPITRRRFSDVTVLVYRNDISLP